MSTATRVILLILIAAAMIFIGYLISMETDSESHMTLMLIPIGIAWLILFPVGGKKPNE
jgi:hypothetical protein